MIILINGSINSGKTTVSELLAKKLKNTAHVEVDKFCEFVDFLPLGPELIKLNLKNAALVARTFIDAGMNVIISYPLSKQNYDFLISQLGELEVDIFCFTLNPKLDSVLKNRGKRELTKWEIERIKYHYKIGINSPEFECEIIDNTHESPEKTVDRILNLLKSYDKNHKGKK